MKSGDRVPLASIPVGMAFICEDGISSIRSDVTNLSCYKCDNINPEEAGGKASRYLSQGRMVTVL